MALVSFTLSEEGVGAFNDALMCVNKFADDVSLEVRNDKVRNSRSGVIQSQGTRLTPRLADSHSPQPHKVRVYILYLHRQPILFALCLPGQLTVS